MQLPNHSDFVAVKRHTANGTCTRFVVIRSTFTVSQQKPAKSIEISQLILVGNEIFHSYTTYISSNNQINDLLSTRYFILGTRYWLLSYFSTPRIQAHKISECLHIRPLPNDKRLNFFFFLSPLTKGEVRRTEGFEVPIEGATVQHSWRFRG